MAEPRRDESGELQTESVAELSERCNGGRRRVRGQQWSQGDGGGQQGSQGNGGQRGSQGQRRSERVTGKCRCHQVTKGYGGSGIGDHFGLMVCIRDHLRRKV